MKSKRVKVIMMLPPTTPKCELNALRERNRFSITVNKYDTFFSDLAVRKLSTFLLVVLTIVFIYFDELF